MEKRMFGTVVAVMVAVVFLVSSAVTYALRYETQMKALTKVAQEAERLGFRKTQDGRFSRAIGTTLLEESGDGKNFAVIRLPRTDPWGQSLVAVYITEAEQESLIVVGFGRDGVAATGDDIAFSRLTLLRKEMAPSTYAAVPEHGVLWMKGLPPAVVEAVIDGQNP